MLEQHGLLVKAEPRRRVLNLSFDPADLIQACLDEDFTGRGAKPVAPHLRLIS